MQKQQGYLLVSVAFAVLLTGFVLTMAMQMSSANHHKAMTAFTNWRVQASAESAMAPIITAGSYYDLSVQPVQSKILSTALSPMRDSTVKIIKKVYKLDISAANLSPYLYKNSYDDPAYSKNSNPASMTYPEVATNLRETHVIGFSMTDVPAYNACMKAGYSEEVTIAPKVDVTFDEDPKHTLSYCLKSKGVDMTHLYQINYGLLDQSTPNDYMIIN